MATARDLCKQALETAGVVALGESVENEIITSTLDHLNDQLEVLNKQKLFPAYEVVTNITLIGGADEYTIGSGGDVTTIARPISVNWLKVQDGSSWFTMDQKSISDFGDTFTTDTSSSIPHFFYYNPVFPLGVLGFFNNLDQTRTFKISVNAVAGPYGLNDTVTLAEGYYPFLKWRLAAVMADIVGKDSSMLWLRANDIEADIKRMNIKPKNAKRDFGSNSIGREEYRALFRS